MSFYDELLEELAVRNYSLSVMESLTGGLFSSTFVSITGASRVFKGGIVAYSADAKIANGVKEETIKKHGTISNECVKEMALAVSTKFNTNVSIAFTGNAGPETQEDKNVGLVFIGIRIGEKLHSFEIQLKGERDKIRKDCVDLGFKILLDKLRGK